MGEKQDIPITEKTVPFLFRRAVNLCPHKTFIRSPDNTLTYSEFNDLTNCCANRLAEKGLKKGGKLGIMMHNSIAFVHSWIAASKLGVIYVPINTDYKGDILQYQLNKADVTHLIVDVSLASRVGDVISELPQLQEVILYQDAETESDLALLAGHCTVSEFENFLIGSALEPSVEIRHTDPLAISFTSGTTGPSKGVLATNCHVISFAMDWITACQFDMNDRLFTPLPMFHAIATWLGVIPTFIVGTEIAFVKNLSISRFWDDVRKYNSSVVHGIFAMVPMLLKQPEREDDKDVPARLFYIGQRNETFETRFNCRIVEVYGATETGIVTYTPLEEEPARGSCGRANTSSYHVAIVDDEDNIQPAGVVGEIVVRPAQPFSMIQEYYNMSTETLDAFRNLWFHTGDNGRLDSDGFFYYVDRKKDAIRRRGENISSFELEVVLNADDRVAECAAIAEPSDLGEDDVKMVVVPAAGTALTAEDIWDLCENRMPKFWVPRYVEFRESLPKTPNQKVQKYLLRKGMDQGPVFDREERDD
ncbi:MAG: ATP-dependent acyl-CoA ligase [Cellvibrionales bacterium TMED148]|nr:ATP-dependent acyl-CoA ligase [Porticoccaceae bacterium]RPG89084.1 MAG: ATP-dependent acyl-CoA ligase [Cellvibrionales bacterium TMED148]